MDADPNDWQAPKQPLDHFDEIDTGPPPTPKVWAWFVVYCVLMALLYLGVVLFGVVMLVMPDSEFDGASEAIAGRIMGGLFLALGLSLTGVFAAAPFLPRRPWVWVYDLVLIGVGMTSACCLPVTIPLIVFWLRPDAKRYFGKA